MKCQYELLGLPPGSTCPECGQLEADVSSRVIDDPPECSSTRLLVVLAPVVSLPLLGLIAETYWFWLYKTSRWGPKPNSSELELTTYIWACVLYFLFLLFPVSWLPWKMTPRQMLLAVGPALVAMLPLNIMAVRSYWNDENITLSGAYLFNLPGVFVILLPPLNFLIAGILTLRTEGVAEQNSASPPSEEPIR